MMKGGVFLEGSFKGCFLDFVEGFFLTIVLILDLLFFESIVVECLKFKL